MGVNYSGPQHKARHFDTIRMLAGHVQDGSDTTVEISQDDATRSWLLRAGKSTWYGTSLRDVLEQARADYAAAGETP